MLKKRVIPVLLLKDGRMVKGRQFGEFRDTGDPQSAVRIYSAQDADELVFLDIQASLQSRGALLDIVRLAATECFMPLAVGGGIRTTDDVREALRAGADKVVITTAAVTAPAVIRDAARMFGNQCVVAGIDYRGVGDEARAWIHCGTGATDLKPLDHAKALVDLERERSSSTPSTAMAACRVTTWTSPQRLPTPCRCRSSCAAALATFSTSRKRFGAPRSRPPRARASSTLATTIRFAREAICAI